MVLLWEGDRQHEGFGMARRFFLSHVPVPAPVMQFRLRDKRCVQRLSEDRST